jgi:hypothetical protein
MSPHQDDNDLLRDPSVQRLCETWDPDTRTEEEKLSDTLEEIQKDAVKRYKKSSDAKFEWAMMIAAVIGIILFCTGLGIFLGTVSVWGRENVKHDIVYRYANGTTAALLDLLNSTFAFQTFNNESGAFLKAVGQ